MLRSIFCLIIVLLLQSAVEGRAQPGAGSRPGLQGLNPEISLNGLFAAAYFSEPDHLNFGGHDPNQTGFTLQNLELTLGATVDPYARADAHIVYLMDREGESAVEVEEAYFTTLSLPHRLQLIGGQFFTRFGRINAMHPHAWEFADQPVINNRLFGPDGLRNPGMQLSYLSPLPFYLELIGSVQNAGGETAVSFLSSEENFLQSDVFPHPAAGLTFTEREARNAGDLLYMTRLKTSWAPSDTIEVAQGFSALSGPNAGGEDAATRIYGADFYAKWRPLAASRGWPFVALQAEAIWRRYEAGGNPMVLLLDRGAYIQSVWGFVYRWAAGLRMEYANGGEDQDPLRDRRYRVSPNLTVYPSEFSKWRLQYDWDLAEHFGGGPIHAVFVQFEFLIGAHGAHQF